MLYSIKGIGYKNGGQVEVDNNLIVQATPAFRWSIGMGLEQVILKSRPKGYKIELLKDQTKRSPSLGTMHEDPVPSDRELVARLGVM